MKWPGRRGPVADVPESVRTAIELGHGEKLLAAALAARDTTGQVWLLATTWRLAAVAGDGRLGWARPWHEVDAASWSPAADQLTLTFVGERRPLVFPLDQEALFLQVVRERVQASVVSSQELDLPGRRKARAVLRHELASGRILEQLAGHRGSDDDELERAAAAAFERLREEVGLPPRPRTPPPGE